MADFVLRVYIDRNAKVNTRSWKDFVRKKSLRRYLLEKAPKAAIGEVHLAEAFGGYLCGNSDRPEANQRTIPDSLNICGPVEGLRVFCELYRSHLDSSRVVWLTSEEFATSPRWLPDLLQPPLMKQTLSRFLYGIDQCKQFLGNHVT